MRSSRFPRLALIVAGAALAASCAAPRPLVVAPPIAAPHAEAAPAPGGCAVVVTGVEDRRRVRDTLGVVAGRAVKSPADIDAWLRAILADLPARDVGVSFAQAAAADAIAVEFGLQSVWLNDIKTSKTATVVAHVSAHRDGAALIDRDYRAALTRMNWNSTDAELQRLIDDAFAGVLDQAAADLRKACAGDAVEIPGAS